MHARDLAQRTRVQRTERSSRRVRVHGCEPATLERMGGLPVPGTASTGKCAFASRPTASGGVTMSASARGRPWPFVIVCPLKLVMRVVRDGKEPYVEQVKYDAQHTTQLECMCALATSKAFLGKKKLSQPAKKLACLNFT